MKQSQKLNALISKIIKEELGSIKEDSKINYKKIPDDIAVQILNNKKYDIETTLDYDYEYRDPATDILMAGDIKANSFDNIGVEERGHPFEEIRLSVYKPGARDPFFLIRNVKNRSWTIGMFDSYLPDDIKEEEKEYVTPDGTSASATSDQIASATRAKSGTIVKYRKAGVKPMKEGTGTLGGFYADGSHKIEQGGKVTFISKTPLEKEALDIVYSALDLECSPNSFQKSNNILILDKKDTCVRSVVSYLENKSYKSHALEGLIMQIAEIIQSEEDDDDEELQETNMEQMPKASEIAGQVAEIMEKLKSMAEGEDPKKGKHAAKVMKYMESAKAALEALTAHETMLEEKDQAAKEKDAQGHLKAIEKHLGKLVKDKDAVGKMMKKMPIEKVIAMKQQLQSKEKELDEEKLAKVMLNKSLKEGWVKQNSAK